MILYFIYFNYVNQLTFFSLAFISPILRRNCVTIMLELKVEPALMSNYFIKYKYNYVPIKVPSMIYS